MNQLCNDPVQNIKNIVNATSVDSLGKYMSCLLKNAKINNCNSCISKFLYVC